MRIVTLEPALTLEPAMIAAWLKDERRRRGWLQKELAKRLGLTQQSVSRFECGTHFPTLEVLRKMAELFDGTIVVRFERN